MDLWVDDIVYHLGDFTPEDISRFTKWVNQLNGNIRILPGNMDRLWLKDFVASEKVQVMAPLVSLEFSEIGTVERSQWIIYSLPLLDASLGTIESWFLALVRPYSWQVERDWQVVRRRS